MSKVRLNLRSLSVQEKVGKAERMVTSLTNNPNFPSPTPALPTVTTAANELRTAANEVDSIRQLGKEKTSVQSAKEDTIDGLLTQLAAYVESVAGDNEQMILSAGLDVRAPAVPSTDVPPAPEGFTATAGDRDGEIDLSWDPVDGAKSYAIDKSPDPAAANTWTHAGISTRSSYTIDGLTSGARYWFRVAAVNGNGQSGWSDPAIKFAP
jgi:hypothetical protein